MSTNSRRHISAQVKVDAVRRVEEGESKASVARDIGVKASTVRGWCRNEKNKAELKRFMVELGYYRSGFVPTSTVTSQNLPEVNAKLLSQLKAAFNPQQRVFVGTRNAIIPTDTSIIISSPGPSRSTLNQTSPDVCFNRSGSDPIFPITSQKLPEVNAKLMTQWKATLKPQQQNVPTMNTTVPADTSVLVSSSGPSRSTLNELCMTRQPGDKNQTPILWQLLTENTERKFSPPPDSRGDNHNDEKDNGMSREEAIQHGERFLEWLESYSHPSITAINILQFRKLLSNVKGVENSQPNKVKAKRK